MWSEKPGKPSTLNTCGVVDEVVDAVVGDCVTTLG